MALMISESLRDQTIQMGLYEMENLLNRCVCVCMCVSMTVCENMTRTLMSDCVLHGSMIFCTDLGVRMMNCKI